MTSTNFIYFLQGYMELTDPETISEKDLEMIKGHLKLAFRDDIDPSMGNYEHQMELSAAHEGMELEEFFTAYPHLNPHGMYNTITGEKQPISPPHLNNNVLERC